MAKVVYWVQDLLFTSKIREVARQLNVEATAVRDAATLESAAKDAQLVIVDLRLPQAMAALEKLQSSTVQKVGFIDHERADIIEKAQSLGCRALAKGKFSTELPNLLGLLS